MLQGFLVRLHRLGVLGIGGAHLANGRHPQGDEVALGLGGVALEVPVQPSLALGHCQRIVWQGEVVHADVAVAVGQEARDGAGQHVQPGLRFRQLRLGNATLRLEPGRQVGVGVQRNPVGPQAGHLGHRGRKRLGRLKRQPVDQVGVDGGEANLAGGVHQLAHLLKGLLTVDGALDIGIEVLHAEADPVESHVRQRLQARCAGGAGIHLNRHLAVLGKPEMLPNRPHQACQLRICQEGGGPPAQVQLRDRLRRPHDGRVQGHFALQRSQVRRCALMAARHHLVAGAVVADGLAERDVDIQGQGGRRTHALATGALAQRAHVQLCIERLLEPVGRRVGRVPRARGIQFLEQGFRKADLRCVSGFVHGHTL